MAADIFRWLPMSDRKGLATPRVMFVDTDLYAGGYYQRTEARCVVEELQVDLRESDLIVLSTHWGDTAASTIAHEHRHLQQRYLLGLPRLGLPVPAASDGSVEGWRRGIRQFYRSQPWEMDALRYSMRVHRDDDSEQQWEAVVRPIGRVANPADPAAILARASGSNEQPLRALAEA